MNEPKLAWTESELATLPPVYMAMICRQHQIDIEQHAAWVEWKRQEEVRKAKEKKKKVSV